MGISDYGQSTDFLSSPSLADWAAAIAAQMLAGPLLDGSPVTVTDDLTPPEYVEGNWWLHPKYGAPAVVSASSGTTGAAGSPTGKCNCTLPPGILDGQTVVAFLIYANATGTAVDAKLPGTSTSAGFTLRGSVVQGANLTTAVMTHPGVAGDSSTTIEFQMSVATGTRMAVVVMVCDAVTVAGLVQNQATESTGTNGEHTTPNVSATGAGVLLELVCERPGSIASNSYTTPAPMTEWKDGYVTSSTSLTWVAASKAVTGSGTEGSHTYTSSGGTQANAQMLTVFLAAA